MIANMVQHKYAKHDTKNVPQYYHNQEHIYIYRQVKERLLDLEIHGMSFSFVIIFSFLVLWFLVLMGLSPILDVLDG